jgi:predicted amidophosphoribosyltransferase
MTIFTLLYETILEALFPLSPVEKELFAHSPAHNLNLLSPAPSYSGLAVPLPEARSIWAYKDERVEQLIWNIKYKKSKKAVTIGGYALFERLRKIHIRAPHTQKVLPDSSQHSFAHVLIIPMPITMQRRRERGYNQCELLVNEVEHLYKKNKDEIRKKNASSSLIRKEEMNTVEQLVTTKGSESNLPTFIFENKLLIRTHHDSRHTLKGRVDRLQSATGIFGINEEIAERLEVRDLRLENHKNNTIVIIIDDVITTGSTMREAINTMKKAGFEKVYGLSLAH